ncbi:aldehyde dehydrogenase family protein [Marinomonas arenicola]|uniref:aldehyde dehydrogenase family protein n=1 Tax=Marinomonas arenicola TaxID=569601 RepID=UPI00311E6003
MQIDVINPATKRVVETLNRSNVEEVNDAVAVAVKTFDTWSRKTSEERGVILHKIADGIEAAAEELARLIVAEQGKPLPVAMMEVGGAAAWTRYNADLSQKPEVLEDSEERRVEVHRLPLGVVASITPWNWPLMIAIWHIMPALKAGNTVVIKPSSNTPLSTIKLVDIVSAIEPGVLEVVLGGKIAGEALVTHPEVKKLVFTGSTPTGTHLASLIAKDLKKVTLELGGNDAGIVLANADIDKQASKIYMSAFINMGQTCAALKRLYVHRSKYDALCNALVDMAKEEVVGNGMEEGVTFGPVQNKNQYDLVTSMIRQARDSGSEVIAPELPEGLDGYFIAPTIIKNPPLELSVVCDEQFGPVLPVIPYDDVKEVMKDAIHKEFALGGSVWGEESDELDWVVEQLDSGTVWINNHAEVLPHIPFGGNKLSGLGVEFGVEGFLENTQRKVVSHFKQ